jgi:diguanylate cyclase (GGDEF)-like protein
MVSLRNKIIFSLIGTSFLAIAFTALIARMLMVSEFDALVENRAAQIFMAETLAFYQEYGSWEAAFATETLFDFAQRKRAEGQLAALDADTDTNLELTPEGFLPPADSLPPDDPRFRPEGASLEGPAAGGPPPGAPQFGGPPPEGFSPDGGPDGGTPGGQPPPPFVLVDITGKVLLPSLQTYYGQIIPSEELARALPIMDGGQKIGYLLTEVSIALTELESQYLSAIEDSWWLALLLVAILAVPLGFLMGNRLASPIEKLNTAIQAMGPGAMQQRVPITSKGELGQLSQSFNQMSEELSDAYDDLEISRAQLMKYGQQMKEMSLLDALTQLPNHRAFNDSAPLILAQNAKHKRTSVLGLIDIDKFKRINDNFSHTIGDEVLRRLSKIMKSNLREIDLIARYGGEEFAVLFPETDLDTSVQLVERLRNAVAETVWINIDPKLQITMSTGLVEVTHASTSEKSLRDSLAAADKMLYKAKHNGRNRTES